MALRILVITPRIPFPLRDGGAIAMNQTLACYLEQGCQVSLLSLNTSRHWVEESELPAWYQRFERFEHVYVKTDINPLSAFLNLFTDKSYNVSRFVNREVEAALTRMLKQDQYDIIQFESIYTSPYLKIARKHSDAACVCRLHNIEYRIWQRLSDHEPSFLKRKYLRLLTNRLRQYELDILKQFDVLLPISKPEAAFLEEEKINRCYYLPFGIDEVKQQESVRHEPDSCFHIGSMDWSPNVEGVHWFLEEIWPELHKAYPRVKLYLAGKKMPPTIRTQAENGVYVVGEVEDRIQFTHEKHIMLVPLLSGAGIRIKILEAMASGKTIIATPQAAEGIGAKPGTEILMAQNLNEFQEAFRICFEHPDKAEEIGKRARIFVENNYRKETIYQQLTEFLQTLKHA